MEGAPSLSTAQWQEANPIEENASIDSNYRLTISPTHTLLYSGVDASGPSGPTVLALYPCFLPCFARASGSGKNERRSTVSAGY
jgi:hypothetical protein